MGKKSPSVGLRQAQVLCTMDHKQRLAYIAEGLPIILSSAEGYWDAACRLKDMPREAEVLQGHATEEAAKILILMDAVRCPEKLVASKMGTIVRSFYNHLARIIYAETVYRKPINLERLREYVDSKRASHYVESDLGGDIFPNWSLFTREYPLYADIMCGDYGEPGWNTPSDDGMGFSLNLPPVLELARAMSAVGLFTLEGLEATSEIWDQMTFTELESHTDTERLTTQLLQRLDDERLLTAAAKQSHFKVLLNTWQMPMYDFDFSLINVSKEKLKDIQDGLYAAEVGYDF